MMRRSPEEKAAARAAFRQMPLAGKLDHIWTYHKWTILLILALVIILATTLHRVRTRKERVLSLACFNAVVGSELDRQLGLGYLEWADLDPDQTEIQILRGLYLSEDASVQSHESAYASRMKLLGMIEAKQLDLVLMSRESYDILSNSGLLLDLEEALPAQMLPEKLRSCLTENEVILSDNAIEYRLGEAEELEVETSTAANGLLVTDLPLFRKAGFEENVYLGLIANTPRLEACVSYLEYITDGGSGPN